MFAVPDGIVEVQEEDGACAFKRAVDAHGEGDLDCLAVGFAYKTGPNRLVSEAHPDGERQKKTDEKIEVERPPFFVFHAPLNPRLNPPDLTMGGRKRE